MAVRYLILGAGRFGCLAWRRLSQQEPAAEFCLVDHEADKLRLAPPGPTIRTVVARAADYLAASLETQNPPDWIIPAVPRHVAFDWLWRQCPEDEIWRPIPVPPALGQNLPYKFQGSNGEYYFSISTERCPDDCPEPAARCSLTGAPRTFNLYDYLENFVLADYTSLVIRSRQLAPGVGGYRPADLWQLRRQALAAAGKLIISTACRCHAVSHGLEKLSHTEAGVGI